MRLLSYPTLQDDTDADLFLSIDIYSMVIILKMFRNNPEKKYNTLYNLLHWETKYVPFYIVIVYLIFTSGGGRLSLFPS